MTGYTSPGAGLSSLPVRFNTRGEVLALTLRCATPAARPAPVSPR